MTLHDFLGSAMATLTAAGITTARLDALVLLEDCLKHDRASLLAHPELRLTAEQLTVLTEQLSRRARHVPLAYIRGRTEFYGREFIVNDAVLEPRPESETMIDLLKTLPESGRTNIIDVGSGSGALAITAKLELPSCRVTAIDIDSACLAVTRKNARMLQADIEILEGDLLMPFIDRQPANYSLLCNLPYVPDSFQINQAASHEPRLAIFGGPDGLDVFRRLFRQIRAFTSGPKYILSEAMPPQHDGLAGVAASHGYRQLKRDDFIQVFTLT